MRKALGVTVASVAALAFPAASGAVVVGSTHLTVRPGRVAPRGGVVVRFAQPTLGPVLPDERTTESLLVTGPAQAGCGSGTDLTVAPTAAGTAMRETLRPAKMTGGRWCPGTFRVALQFAQFSTCSIGVQLHVCPEYVIEPTTVATARFRVVAATG